MVKREIVSVHVGQAGVQIANALWELYCMEHSIDPDGCLVDTTTDDANSYETFFDKTENDRCVPRAVFFDTENILIDEISTGAYRQLYHPLQLIKGTEDAANNFARGSLTISKQYIYQLLERIRRLIEQCDTPEGFFLTHSLGGGTGSGFTSLLSHALLGEYAKFTRLQVPIYPGQVLSTSVVEPYNTVLHIHSTVHSMDLALLLGNEALYDLCENLLYLSSPTYSDVNRLVALMTSSATGPLRYKGQLNSDLGEMQTNLVPYPRIHFPELRYAPIQHNTKTDFKPAVGTIVKELFTKKYQTIKIDSTAGCYIAIVMNYRGILSQREVSESLHTLKMKGIVNFVDWCPTGFKVSLNGTAQLMVPESQIAMTDFSISMIANSTFVKEAWIRMNRKFVSLFEKRAFVHWFVDEGMEEFEFDDAHHSMLMLIDDYNEICKTTDDVEEDEKYALDKKRSDVAAEARRKDSEGEDEDEEEEIGKQKKGKKDKRLLHRRHTDRTNYTKSPRFLKHKKHSNSSKVEKRIVRHKTEAQKRNTALLFSNPRVNSKE